MFGIGVTELIVVLAVALIVFGPGKLPGVGKALGKSINEFRRAVKGIDLDEEDLDKDDSPPPPRLPE